MSQLNQLQEANNVIEKNKEVLREIAFNQSHIVRRPLANIMGLSFIIQKMEVDQNMRNLLDMIIESCNQLDDVIKAVVNKTTNSEA